MGCLNSNENFTHWFGNIHLSGPCNRSCYFCIGQHMMDLDSYNVLNTDPLPGLDEFISNCEARSVKTIYVTGTNTEPLLYKHTHRLKKRLLEKIPGLTFGVRSNAALFEKNEDVVALYDKGSVTICSTDQDVYNKMMGPGKVPSIQTIVRLTENCWSDLKVNIVLGPENSGKDIHKTLVTLEDHGVTRVNVREPYGQPHVGDPMAGSYERSSDVLGMPSYKVGAMSVTYWDVHYVEVESVNLYASGRVSETYPITLGHSDNGNVRDQTKFSHGRHVAQWQKLPVLK